MTKEELIDLINNKFEIKNQEIWDRCGIYNFNNTELNNKVNGIYISLDLTLDCIKNAIENNCDIIITHHPLYIGEISKLPTNIFNIIYEKINLLKTNNIIHICLHTCFDRYNEGTSYQLAKYILKNESDINIKKLDNSKYSYYFELDNETTLEFFLQFLSHKKVFKTLKTPKQFLQKQIKKVGISSGSGISDYYKYVDLNIDIDCFLTGDIKWHNYIDSYEIGIPIVDIGHDSEAIFIFYIYEFIKEETNIVNIKKSNNSVHILEFIL